MTREEFKANMLRIGGAYNGKFDLPHETMDIWYDRLHGYDNGIMRAAVDRYIDENTFPPVIADIKRLCEERLSEIAKENVYINTNWSFITSERPPREDTEQAKKDFMQYLSRFDNRVEQSRTVLRWVKKYKGGKTLEELMKQLCES